jgi:hypothetical protein
MKVFPQHYWRKYNSEAGFPNSMIKERVSSDKKRIKVFPPPNQRNSNLEVRFSNSRITEMESSDRRRIVFQRLDFQNQTIGAKRIHAEARVSNTGCITLVIS